MNAANTPSVFSTRLLDLFGILPTWLEDRAGTVGAHAVMADAAFFSDHNETAMAFDLIVITLEPWACGPSYHFTSTADCLRQKLVSDDRTVGRMDWVGSFSHVDLYCIGYAESESQYAVSIVWHQCHRPPQPKAHHGRQVVGCRARQKTLLQGPVNPSPCLQVFRCRISGAYITIEAPPRAGRSVEANFFTSPMASFVPLFYKVSTFKGMTLISHLGNYALLLRQGLKCACFPK